MSDVRLYNGDCLSVLPTLEAGSVDAVVTDPPYGIGFSRYASHDDDWASYADWMRRVVVEVNRVVAGGPVFMWQGMPNADRWHEWLPRGFRLFAACKGFVQYRPTPVQFSWDPVAFWGNVPKKPSVYAKDYHEQRQAPFGKNRPRVAHPCPRPLEQVRYVVELCTNKGGTVLDPFAGSGTTGVACLQTGRRFVGIECDPGYFKIAQERIAGAQAGGRVCRCDHPERAAPLFDLMGEES